MDVSIQLEVGVDIGGTFTDVVCRMPDGRLNVVKLPTTRHDPRLAIGKALDHMVAAWGVRLEEIVRFSHGTTLATNAVIERKGAKIGLITTEGFRDVLEIGRQFRRATYDLILQPEAPTFLAPGSLRKEVRERVSPQGDVVVALDEEALLARANELIDDGVEAIGICFLFSFANPVHERRARELIAEAFPQVMLSLSHEIDPAFREYERTCVTAFDAYLKPILDRYLGGMEGDLRDRAVPAPLQIMLSRGGKCSAAVARMRPVRLFLSGPAAGVIGGCETARGVGLSDVITYDVGGTSCDIALVTDGKPLIAPEGEIAGYPVRVPLVDVNTIGAGGGSIAWIDGAGALRAGPHSAGSEPGPACYGRGGDAPTVTDASVVLGYLNPANFAGGTLTLDPALAWRVVDEKIARPLALSVEEAARGIHRVINAQMAEGIRFVSVYRGFDPRDFTLVALGGAGPVHATAVARELGIARVVVPLRPGVLSACGLIIAPVEHEVSGSFLRQLTEASVDEVRAALERLDERGGELMVREAIDHATVRVEHFADVCYVGQSYYLEVPLSLTGTPDPLATLYDNFRAQHDRVYGHSTEAPAKIVNLRSVHRATAAADLGEVGELSGGAAAPATTRRIIPAGGAEPVEARVYARRALAADHVVDGPAIIEQSDTTTLIEPGWRGQVDDRGNLVLVMAPR